MPSDLSFSFKSGATFTKITTSNIVIEIGGSNDTKRERESFPVFVQKFK